MAQWQNDDGLTVRFGQDQARETQSLLGINANTGPVKYAVADIVWNDLPTFTTDLNNNGTNNGFSDQDAYIPAGSYISRAWLIVETAFTGTSITLGLYTQAGSAIDADGIDVAVGSAALAANQAVDCNGQLVGTQDLLTADAYLVVTDDSTDLSTGKAKLVIEYIQVAP